MHEAFQYSLLVFPNPPRRSQLRPVAHLTGLLFKLLQVFDENFFLRSALSCVITQNSADLVHLAAAAWNHVQNFVMLRLSPLVTLKLITASSQMLYRVLLTHSFTPFLNDTVHMCRVPSLSLIYPSWQIIFGDGHEANNRSNRTMMYWFFSDWETLLQVQKLYRCLRNR